MSLSRSLSGALVLLIAVQGSGAPNTTPKQGEGKAGPPRGEYRDDRSVEVLSVAAQARKPQAQTVLGWRYYHGVGVKRDDARAVELWRKAAEADNARGMLRLGQAYADGRGGLDRSAKQSRRWLKRAAEGGDPLAMAYYAHSLCHGDELNKRQLAECRRWNERAAARGNLRGVVQVARMQRSGRGLPRDPRAARARVARMLGRVRAEQLTPELDGMVLIGDLHRRGRLVRKDERAAVDWYRRTARHGSPRAMRRLGHAHRYSDGVKQDDEKAVRWWGDGAAAIADGPPRTVARRRV